MLSSLLLTIFDTVEVETPAIRAMSLMFTAFPLTCLFLCNTLSITCPKFASAYLAGRQAWCCAKINLKQFKTALFGDLHDPDRLRHSSQQGQLRQAHQRLLQTYAHSIGNAAQHLNQLNPENVLNRGFAYVQTQNGDIVYNASALRAGDGIAIRLARGRVIGTVNHTETE